MLGAVGEVLAGVLVLVEWEDNWTRMLKPKKNRRMSRLVMKVKN